MRRTGAEAAGGGTAAGAVLVSAAVVDAGSDTGLGGVAGGFGGVGGLDGLGRLGRLGKERFGGRCGCFGERFQRRVLVLARVEQAGAEIVVRAFGVEAEAAVMDDAAQLELQFERQQCGGRTLQADRHLHDLPRLLDGLGDGGVTFRHPATPKFVHPQPNVTVRHKNTAPLPRALGRIPGQPGRLRKAGAARGVVGEKLLAGEEPAVGCEPRRLRKAGAARGVVGEKLLAGEELAVGGAGVAGTDTVGAFLETG